MPPRRRVRAVFDSESEGERESQRSQQLSSSPASSPGFQIEASPLSSPSATTRRRGPVKRVTTNLTFEPKPVSNDLQFLQDSIAKSLEEAFSFGLDLSEANLLEEVRRACLERDFLFSLPTFS